MKKREFILAAMAASASLLGLPALAQQTKDAQKEAQKFNLHGLDANGKKLELSDYLGKTVLVSFFYRRLQPVFARLEIDARILCWQCQA